MSISEQSDLVTRLTLPTLNNRGTRHNRTIQLKMMICGQFEFSCLKLNSDCQFRFGKRPVSYFMVNRLSVAEN